MLWTSRQQGDELLSEARAAERRIEQLELGLAQERLRLEAQIAELEQVLQQATSVVTRNSADVGAQVQQLRDQASSMEGELAELRYEYEAAKRELTSQILELEQRIEAIGRHSATPEVSIPSDKDNHFAEAERAFEAAEYAKARVLLKAFVERHASDSRAGHAQYLVGATYLADKRPATALGEYRKVLAQFPRSEWVNEALYDMASAFFELHACTDAKSALQALIQRKVNAQVDRKAKAKLQEVERAPKGYCTS